MEAMQKKWSNPAIMSFICGLLGWWIPLTEALRQIKGLKLINPGAINILLIIVFILICFLAILLGIRAIRQIKVNQGLSGKAFAILGILLAGLAILCVLVAFITLDLKYEL